MGGGWGAGSRTEQSQSEPTANLQGGDGGGREERPERGERGRKKGGGVDVEQINFAAAQ
jgi:hypothetical protein